MSSKTELACPPSPLPAPPSLFLPLLFLLFQAQCQQRGRGTGPAWTLRVPWYAVGWRRERFWVGCVCPGYPSHHAAPPPLGRSALKPTGSLRRRVRVSELSSGRSLSIGCWPKDLLNLEISILRQGGKTAASGELKISCGNF